LNLSVVSTDQDIHTSVCILLAILVAGNRNCFV